MSTQRVNAIFLDIGGVLLTNGWDRKSRKKACDTFHLDFEEMDERHHLTFDTYEEGKLTLDEYLKRIVFYEKRDFSPKDFKEFMFAQSQPYPEMIELIKGLKKKYAVKTATVSNEGRELTEYRLAKFGLDKFIDFFVMSCYVHFRKPDHDIFCMALDIAHSEPGEVVYIEDRPLFVQEANEMGIHGLRHTDYESTKAALSKYGLVL